MRILLTIILLSFCFSVLAGEVVLELQHPRKENRKSYTNEVSCSVNCKWKLGKKGNSEGTTESEKLKVSLKEVSSLFSQKKIPVSKSSLPDREKYLIIHLKDGDRSQSLELGFARSYEGEELKKYHKLNKLLAEIEFIIGQESRKQ